MTRIASYSANLTLINQMLQTQSSLNVLQVQVTSGKVSQDYLGIAGDSERLLNLENTKAQLERFQNNNTQQDVRLNIQSTVVDGIRKDIKDFNSALDDYDKTNGSTQLAVDTLQANAYRILRDIQNLLNTDVGGRFIFSGSRVTNEPVDLGLTSIADFQSKFDGKTVTVPTTRDASLESFSYSQDKNNLTTQYVNPSNFLTFLQDSDGNTATSSNSSITATSALFSNVAVGSTINVSGTASNNGTYTVASVSSDGRTVQVGTSMFTDEVNVVPTSIKYRDPLDVNVEKTLNPGNVTNLTFNRAASTMTAAVAGSLSDIPVGARFTVAGTTQNNGDYTVTSNNGTTITVTPKRLTDEGNGSGNTFFDFHTGSQVVFTANGGSNDDTIAIQQNGGAGVVPDAFNGLAVGDTVTIANTGSNNTTYTVNAISADGSTITVDETVTNETDFNATFSGSNSFAYTVGTQIVFDAATDTITVQDTGAAAVAGAFSQLKAGMSITISGATTNNGVFTIASVAANGSSITVNQDITVNETDTDGTRIRSFAAAGTIASNSYYSGDTVSSAQRVSELRSFDDNVTAIDPAFEKAIRAMKLILQGQYGTAGGLDQNKVRVSQARYLIDSSLDFTVSGTAPFGTEQTSNIAQIQQNIGFNQLLVKTQNKLHTDFIGFIDTSISGISNVDQLTAITKLLDEQRALEASYQTFSRLRQLSLTNFL